MYVYKHLGYIYELYKKAESSFWTVNDIDLSKDINDWNEKLNENENQHAAAWKKIKRNANQT